MSVAGAGNQNSGECGAAGRVVVGGVVSGAGFSAGVTVNACQFYNI